MHQEALREAIRVCGSQQALADQIGHSQQLISYWLNHAKRLPAEVAVLIEGATDGKVRKSQLRPDVFKPRPKPEAA